MNRRRFLLGTSAGLLTARSLRSRFSAGCVTPEAADEVAVRAAKKLRGTRQITLRILIPAGSEACVGPVARSFHSQTGTSIALESVPVDEINSRMLIRTMARRPAFDLALPASFGIPDLVEADCLRDLTEFASRHEPASHQAGSLYSLGDYYKGRLYGYQSDGDAYLLFFNERLMNSEAERKRFEDAHGRPMTLPETWEELDLLVRHFHRPEAGVYGGMLFRNPAYVAWEYWMRLHSLGRLPVAADMTPLLGTAEGVAAAEALTGLTPFLHPCVRANGLTDNWKAFARGNALVNIGWGGTQKYLLSALNEKLPGVIVTMPPGRRVDGKLIRPGYFNWGWNYCVSTLSSEPELAYLFALYAASAKMSAEAICGTEGFFDPFRREHFDDERIREIYQPGFLDPLARSLETCIPDFYLKGQSRYFDSLRTSLVNVLDGHSKPDQAMDQVAKSWRLITRDEGPTEQAERWRAVLERYPESVRAHLRG